jgi:high-affinity Fe2+/Pb2+ permease
MSLGGSKPGGGRDSGSGRDETPEERADRNLSELLQELRVALPGVQILFAFLLTVPFSQGFTRLDDFQRELYFGVLMSTAVATALLIAPSAHHRLLFRMRDKENLVRISNRLSIAGLLVLSVSLTGAILLVADILFKSPAPLIFTVLIGGILMLLWVVLPVMRRLELEAHQQD